MHWNLNLNLCPLALLSQVCIVATENGSSSGQLSSCKHFLSKYCFMFLYLLLLPLFQNLVLLGKPVKSLPCIPLLPQSTSLSPVLLIGINWSLCISVEHWRRVILSSTLQFPQAKPWLSTVLASQQCPRLSPAIAPYPDVKIPFPLGVIASAICPTVSPSFLVNNLASHRSQSHVTLCLKNLMAPITHRVKSEILTTAGEALKYLCSILICCYSPSTL